MRLDDFNVSSIKTANLLVLLLNCSVPRGFHYVTEEKEKDSKQIAKKKS